MSFHYFCSGGEMLSLIGMEQSHYFRHFTTCTCTQNNIVNLLTIWSVVVTKPT